MKIAIDAMGGDYAPSEIIKGAIKFIGENKSAKLFIIGKENIINKHISETIKNQNNIEIINAEEVIEFDEAPALAIRRKKKSSIVIGMKMLKNKEIDAFVSAGSTGALLAGGLFIVGRIKGIKRPALSVFLPSPKKNSMLLDIGANSDVKPKNLQEFAIMGSLYTKKIMGINNPTVALLNNGTEEGKGSELTKEAYKLLMNTQNINFIGNIEAREVSNGDIDVIVTDGFTGNIYIKTAEGIAKIIMSSLKESIMSSLKSKIAGLFLKSNFKKIKQQFNSEEIGGAPFLGIDGIIIKAHGNSKEYAFFNAINQAKRAIQSNYVEDLKKELIECDVEEKDEDDCQ